MSKSGSFNFNRLFILFLVLIVLCIPVFSNPAQVEIFNAGINLGLAESRLHLFGQEAWERFILRDLRRARENITTGETLMSQFTSICQTRSNLIARIIRKIDDYSRSTRNINANAREHYIHNIFLKYRSALSITLDSSRPDTCRSQPNCDSKLALAGYKYGQAWQSSGGQGNRFRTWQKGRLSEMRDAIRKGIWLSMDIPNQRFTMTGIKKICCSFGDREEWYQFMNSLRANSILQTFENLNAGIQGTIRRANLNNTPCQSGENLGIGLLKPNCYYVVSGVRSPFAVVFRSNGVMDVFRGITTNPETGSWSYNSQTNVLSFSTSRWGNFGGTIKPSPHNSYSFYIYGTGSCIYPGRTFIQLHVQPNIPPELKIKLNLI